MLSGPLELSEQQVLAQFLDTITIPDHNTRKPFVIGMVGIVGSGKSTVAEALAKRLNLFVGSNDAIRRFLNQLGFEGESPNQPLLQFVAENATRYLAQRDISHVIDADLLKFYDSARQNVESMGMKFYLVHVDCPEEVILQRLEARTKATLAGKTSNHSRVGLDEYNRRKQIYTQTLLPKKFDFTFDTSKEVEPQVETFAEQLTKEGVV